MGQEGFASSECGYGGERRCKNPAGPCPCTAELSLICTPKAKHAHRRNMDASVRTQQTPSIWDPVLWETPPKTNRGKTHAAKISPAAISPVCSQPRAASCYMPASCCLHLAASWRGLLPKDGHTVRSTPQGICAAVQTRYRGHQDMRTSGHSPTPSSRERPSHFCLMLH